MTELLSLPWYSAVVPVCAVIGAIVVSKALNISQLASFIGAAAPLGIPYADISVPSHSLLAKPPVQVLGGWGICLGLALTWVVLRAFLRVVKGPMGLLRMTYSLLLAVAGLVVVLLIADPKMLHTYAPMWRETVGVILLSTMMASVGLTLMRVFTSAAFLVACSIGTVILASQVFFEKMPHELEKGDIKKIERVLPGSLPKGLVESGMEGLLKVSASTRSVVRPASEDSES
jgi:hypothetical protein